MNIELLGITREQHISSAYLQELAPSPNAAKGSQGWLSQTLFPISFQTRTSRCRPQQ